MRKTLSICKPEELMCAFYYYCENAIKICRENQAKNNYDLLDVISLCDLEGITLYAYMCPTAIGFFQNAVTEYETYFSGYVGKIYIVNVPYIFKVLWSVIAPMLSPVNREKVVIINQYDELLNYFDKECLPRKYGGTCHDCEGDCTPKSVLEKDQNINLLKIPAGDKKTFKLDVKKGDKVDYSLTSKNYDINFGINLKRNNSDAIEIVPLNRVKSHLEPINGIINIENDGELIATIDNSYSYLRSKQFNFEYFKE